MEKMELSGNNLFYKLSNYLKENIIQYSDEKLSKIKICSINLKLGKEIIIFQFQLKYPFINILQKKINIFLRQLKLTWLFKSINLDLRKQIIVLYPTFKMVYAKILYNTILKYFQ